MAHLHLLRALLIDEEPVRRSVTEQVLRGQDVDTTAVASGAEGLWRLCSTRFDLVVLADRLAGMSGAEAVQVIRRGGAGQPVVFGLADDPQQRRAFVGAGVDEAMASVPDIEQWRDALQRVDPRQAGVEVVDLGALRSFHIFRGQASIDAVVEDFLEVGLAAMQRLRNQLARSEARAATRTVRVFGRHSRVVGAVPLGRVCEDLEDALASRDLRAASGHLLRLQDEWTAVTIALEPGRTQLAS